MYLVDTNVVSELARRRPHLAALAWLESQPTLALSAVTVEELAFGVARAPAGQADRLRGWFERLLAIPPEVIAIDQQIASTAGTLRAERERGGVVMAQADALVAATARVTGRVLVTRNTRHFEGCGIPLLNPFVTAPPRAARRAPARSG